MNCVRVGAFSVWFCLLFRLRVKKSRHLLWHTDDLYTIAFEYFAGYPFSIT